MLHGRLWDRIPQFAFPLAVTGLLQQLFNATDLAVVGRFAGEHGKAAMAAIGANGPVIGLLISAVLGISLGTNVLTANAKGRGDETFLRKVLHTSVVFSVIVGVVVSVLAEVFAVQILSLMNVPEDVVPKAARYFRIFMGGVPIIMLYNFEAAAFRGIGNTKTPLKVLTFSGVLNVLLNLFFVCVIKMNVEGVAYATVIANAVSAVTLFVWLLRSRSALRLRVPEFRIDFPILGRILRLGIPAGITGAVFSVANLTIQSAINSLGTVVMAASSAAFTIEIFAYIVLNSFSQACTTFTGQNNGAGLPGRCKRVLKLCFLEGIVTTAFAATLILVFGHRILSIFTSDPAIIKVGYFRLVVVFFAYIFTLSYEVICGYLRGFGIAMLPAILTVVGVCGVRVGWILLAFPHFRSFGCIMAAYPISLSTTALLMLIALMIIKPASRMKAANRRENREQGMGVTSDG